MKSQTLTARSRTRGVAALALGGLFSSLFALAPINVGAVSASATPCPTSTCVLDNGALRFGNGSDNSVNEYGNLQQPFYRSPADSNYYKLTYSSYPLDMAVGSGTGGTNWSGSTVQDSYATPLANQTIDYSGYTVTGTAGSVTTGYGTIVSVGEMTLNGQTVQITNEYILNNGVNFVKINTSVKNISGSSVSNLNVWVGTRDDYVGSTDEPQKTKGNLDGADGAFQATTNATDPASALMIQTADEGALFYSTSAGVNMAINECCDFNNAYNQNPTTSVIQSPYQDGAYAAILPFGDITDTTEVSITWFYAAGSLSQLDAIAKSVAAAGTPAVPAGVAGDSSAALTWTAPTSADPIVNYLLRYSPDSGSTWITVDTGATALSANVTGLANGIDYLFQVAAVSSPDGGVTTTQGSWSASSLVVTPGTPGVPTVDSVTPGETTASIAFTAGTAAVDPTTNYIYSLNGGSTWTALSPASTTSPFVVTGLTASTSYSIKLRAVNTYGVSPASASVSFSTTSAPAVAPSTYTDSTIGQMTEGESYSDAIAADGSPAPTYAVTAGTLPAGLSLDANTGAITGTPSASGAYSFTVTATNSAGTLDQVFSGTVDAAPAPTTTAPAPTTTAPAPTTTAPVPTTTAPAPTTTAPAPTTTAPAPTPANGSLPEVPTGAGQMTREDGVVVQVPVQKVADLIQIGTSDFNMALTPRPGAVSYENSNIVLKSESVAVVTGAGFQPGSTVEIWVFSTPRLLGTAVVKADGTFSTSVLVPGDLTVGQHTLQAEGLNAAGQPRAVSAGVTVSRDMFLGSTTRVQFSSNSSYLTRSSRMTLDGLVAKAKSAGATKITITGHTDSLGKSSSNTKLSRSRANAVAAYLKLKLKGSGIAVTVSYKGKDAPATSNSTKAGRATNRRADVVPS